jgi:nicotinamidase-related amidase
MKNALLLIDPQIDFCQPIGSLYIPGADDDMKRVAQWITRNTEALSFICYTLDSHVVNTIFHPTWFENGEGQHPKPFTQITVADVETGVWKARYYPQATLTYLKALELQGSFTHTIWPEHCILGSIGHAVVPLLLESIRDWARHTGRPYQPVIKGMHPQTEHYGIFAAEVPLQGQPTTELNVPLLNTLKTFDRIYLAGEAQSHCVATSLRQLLEHAPDVARKLVVLTDCMSPVPGFEHLADSIYDNAKRLGVVFQTSLDPVA